MAAEVINERGGHPLNNAYFDIIMWQFNNDASADACGAKKISDGEREIYKT